MNFEEDLKLLDSFLFFLKVEKGLAENTVISYRFDLIDLIKFLNNEKKRLKEATYFDVLAFFEFAVKEKDIESTSQLRKISVFFNFFEFLIEEKGFTYNPVKDFERPLKNETLPIFLEKEETVKLLDFAKKDRSRSGIRDSTIIHLLYSSGMRISECLSLKLSDVLDFKKTIKSSALIMGKGGKERIVFINSEAKNTLKEYLEIREGFSKNSNSFLFNSDSKLGHLTRQNFFYSLKNIAYKAKLSYEIISPHKIRHSFATHLFSNGIDIRILQTMLGHSDISSTQIYTHINSAELQKTINTFHPFGKK